MGDVSVTADRRIAFPDMWQNAEAAKAWVLGDRLRLQQSLVALLDNAASYTPRGGHVRVGLDVVLLQGSSDLQALGITRMPDKAEQLVALSASSGINHTALSNTGASKISAPSWRGNQDFGDIVDDSLPQEFLSGRSGEPISQPQLSGQGASRSLSPSAMTHPELCHAPAGQPCALRVTVSDTGRGIEPAQQAQLFLPFARLQSGDEGTGLGLNIAKRAMRAHGGDVTVSSGGAGRGSVFTLSALVYRVTPASESPSASAAHRHEPRSRVYIRRPGLRTHVSPQHIRPQAVMPHSDAAHLVSPIATPTGGSSTQDCAIPHWQRCNSDSSNTAGGHYSIQGPSGEAAAAIAAPPSDTSRGALSSFDKQEAQSGLAQAQLTDTTHTPQTLLPLAVARSSSIDSLHHKYGHGHVTRGGGTGGHSRSQDSHAEQLHRETDNKSGDALLVYMAEQLWDGAASASVLYGQGPHNFGVRPKPAGTVVTDEAKSSAQLALSLQSHALQRQTPHGFRGSSTNHALPAAPGISAPYRASAVHIPSGGHSHRVRRGSRSARSKGLERSFSRGSSSSNSTATHRKAHGQPRRLRQLRPNSPRRATSAPVPTRGGTWGRGTTMLSRGAAQLLASQGNMGTSPKASEGPDSLVLVPRRTQLGSTKG
jgi:hypothetical protein